MDARGTLAVGGAKAVGAGIAAAEDDDLLARGGDRNRRIDLVTEVTLVLLGQEFHREVDAVELASRNGQVAGLGCSHGEADRVELRAHLVGVDVEPYVAIGHDFDALGLHLFDTALDVVLLELEVGNPVHQQPADAVGSLVERNRVTGARQLLRAGEARRPRTHHRHTFPTPARGRLRHDPAFSPRMVDDVLLDQLDGDGVVVDVEDAGFLARCGAHAPGELWKVIG